jgi:hypothetical protein
MPAMRNNNGNGAEYIKLERRLVLLAWLNGMFGYTGNKELLSDIKEADEGCDDHGRSYKRAPL